MAKLPLLDLTSLQNETTAIQALNENFEAIEEAFDNTLSRDGTTPNQLESDLDVNSQRIINLAPPQSSTDAARLVDVQEAALPTIVVPALSGNTGKLLSNDGSALSWLAPTSVPGIGDLRSSNNLSDIADASTARTNLGLGTAAQATIGTSGDALGKLNASNTWSAGQTFTGACTSSGGWTFSGTGEVRISSSPTTLNTDSAGFRGAPHNTQDATYTLVLLDSGKTIKHTSAATHTWTIPPNSSVAFPVGTTVVLMNIGSGAVTISPGSGVTLRTSGTGSSGSKSFAQHGVATITKADTDVWYISGTNIS